MVVIHQTEVTIYRTEVTVAVGQVLRQKLFPPV